MKIPYTLFYSQDPVQLRNYLYTFGYLIVGDFFKSEEIVVHNNIWDSKFRDLTRQNTDNTNTYLSVPNYIEKSEAPFFTSDGGERFLKVVNCLVGENSSYLGSSAAEMSVPTPWHRDILLQTPILKFASYINSFDSHDTSEGNLTLVPGSQHAGDVYSDSLSSAVDWPERFGISRAPVIYPMLQASDGSTSLDDYPKRNPAIAPFPFVELKVNALDLVIFDQRLVHGSTYYTNGKARRMLVSVFTLNPRTIEKRSKFVAQGYKAADALLELNQFVLNQINSSDLITLYDDLELRPDITMLLGQKLSQFKDIKRTAAGRVRMRDSLDLEREFNRRNMTDRDVPVCY